MRELGRVSYNRGTEHTLLYTTIFVVAILISMSLLLIACVVTLADILGSLILSLLITGAALLIIAIMIYFIKLRPTLVAMQEQLRTIYEVSAIAQVGYNWVMSKVDSLFETIAKRKFCSAVKNVDRWMKF